MERESKQRPREPVGRAYSFIYDPEIANPEPPEHVTAVPEWPVSKGYARVLKFEAIYAVLLQNGLAVFSVLLAILMFVQVVLRYGFNSPFVGIEEMALLFGAWIYFPAMAYVSRQGEHIHGGILTLVVKSPLTIQKVRLIMTLLSIVVCVIFGYFAIQYVWFEIEKGRLSSYLRWPKGIWSLSLIVGFLGTFIALLMQTFNQAADIKRLRSMTREAS